MNDEQALRILVAVAIVRQREYLILVDYYMRENKPSLARKNNYEYQQLTEAIDWAEKKLEDSEA